MGCFSFKCSGCSKPINSDSSTGQLATLILLDRGEVVEWMQGQYDSYGRVFDSEGESAEWTLPWSEIDKDASEGVRTVCDLMFDKDERTGMAAYHTRCWNGRKHDHLPTVSEDDPEQGWGRYKAPTSRAHARGVPKTIVKVIRPDLP